MTIALEGMTETSLRLALAAARRAMGRKSAARFRHELAQIVAQLDGESGRVVRLRSPVRTLAPESADRACAATLADELREFIA